jgi:ubiquinone biosynthesis protein COQ9
MNLKGCVVTFSRPDELLADPLVRMQVDWYATRTRLGTIYGLAELHQVSPSFSPLSESERIESTLELVDRLLEHSGNIKKSVADAELFAQWVSRSWMGMGRSLGL